MKYLVDTDDIQEHVKAFKHSEYVILAFPLYTDVMPGLVKKFIEALEPVCGNAHIKGLGFIVQSGFPEPVHMRAVEAYLEKLTRRIGCPYLGTVVRGGVEGVRVMPERMNRKLFTLFYELGVILDREEVFDPNILKKLAPRETMAPWRLGLFKMLQPLGVTNMYWNRQLKKNGVFDERFNRPFN